MAGTITLGIATVLAMRVHVPADEIRTAAPAGDVLPSGTSETSDARQLSKDEGSLLEGFRLFAHQRDLRLLAGLLSGRMLLIGAFDVLFVLMALELFQTGESGAGLLNAAVGAGGMVGGAVTLSVAGRHHLGPALVSGAITAGTCVIVIGLRRQPWRRCC